jgi:uncharacterized protein
VVNNSTSKPSADWPTPWPSGSFRAGATALLVVLVVVPMLGFGVWQAIASATTHIDVKEFGNPLLIIATLVVTLLVEGTLVLILIALLPWASRLTLGQLGYHALRGRDIAIAFIGSLVMAVVANGGAALIEAALHTPHDQTAVVMLQQVHDPRLLTAFAIFAIVVAPLLEETIFRVFLFNAARRYYGFWVGAIVSGLCFGIAHGDPIAAIPLALGGIVLAFVYYRTGNAFASMITHGLFNSYTVLALIFAPQLAK